MFTHIMVPVDLAHAEKLGRSLKCAADLARHWGSKITYVGVSGAAPGALGHTPAEFSARLARFAAAQSELEGIKTGHHAVIAHDPSSDLNKVLLKAVRDIGADMVVMESHLPKATDYIWASHGGFLAEHAGVSVMLVRA
ncbi:universal stress protein [Aliishimia ponticola]|uniref:Universal stress protein n=1 Tax=Aliishimia ponticola TaxID=2499833 RepID=A0A4S4NIW3_9RHOB|nr:universal stress protein [Aliishimia ponticola]THH38677.1 universal stress protein [Aliishimia ponticola]